MALDQGMVLTGHMRLAIFQQHNIPRVRFQTKKTLQILA
jgi:hypothetical protein